MAYSPLFVASTGRSGSTLLMKLLSSHPQIAVRSIFPYETRAAQYYYLRYAAPLRTPPWEPLTHKGTIYIPSQHNDAASGNWAANQNATLDMHGINYTQSYYAQVCAWENKHQARYFAEKSVGFDPLEDMIAAFPDSRILCLLRDPRDIFISIKSFNKKRGYLAFGEQAGESALFHNIVEYQSFLHRLQMKLGKRAIAVRYESLVSRASSVMADILQALELTPDVAWLETLANMVTQEDAHVRAHRSSKNSVLCSIGRWKEESSEEMRALFATHNDAVRELEYE